MRIAAGAFSDVGRVREVNEDAHLVDDRLALFAIADGMGGHQGGEVASWTAIEALRAAVAGGQPINDAVQQANAAVLERAAGDPALEGMGTTMTAAVVAGGRRLLLGHVGDSRAYLWRDGELSRLTEDHSLVEELVREGRLTREQAETHPQKAIVTRALGVDSAIDVDVYSVEVEPGDRVLLCSDGLTDMVRERDIERLLAGEPDPQRAAERLVDEANEAGGVDNVTVVVLDVIEVSGDDPPDPAVLAAEPAPRVPRPEPAPDVEPAPVEVPRPGLARRIRGAALLVVPLVVILAVAIAAVGWYARRSYFVGLDGEQVVLYRGVPGGVLGWDPTVEERTGLVAADLGPIARRAVADGAARGSRATAQRYIERIEAQVAATTTTTTTSTTSTTATTSAPSAPSATTPSPATTASPFGTPARGGSTG